MSKVSLKKSMKSDNGILIATISVPHFDDIELANSSPVQKWMVEKTNQKYNNDKTIELRLWNYSLYFYAKDENRYNGYHLSLCSTSPDRLSNNDFIEKTLKNPEITKFEGSLTINDYYKLLEIIARNELKFLSDEQFSVLAKFYLDEIDCLDIKEHSLDKPGSFITEECWDALYELPNFEIDGITDLTLIEEKTLSDSGLLESSLIEEQCEKLAQIGEENPYFRHFNREYMNEFIKASQTNNMSRSLIDTIRSELKGENQNLFKMVFDENDDDIVIKF